MVSTHTRAAWARLTGQGFVPLLAPVQLVCRSFLSVLCDMSRSDSLTSLLSQQETNASTSLLVIGILVGGSTATAALWLPKRSCLWNRHAVDKSAQLPDKIVADQFLCVLDGLSKPYRRDAIEVATCFGITDVWVRMANATY